MHPNHRCVLHFVDFTATELNLSNHHGNKHSIMFPFKLGMLFFLFVFGRTFPTVRHKKWCLCKYRCLVTIQSKGCEWGYWFASPATICSFCSNWLRRKESRRQSIIWPHCPKHWFVVNRWSFIEFWVTAQYWMIYTHLTVNEYISRVCNCPICSSYDIYFVTQN